MTTADISMQYSAMEGLATEIGGLQEQFETMCSDLDSLVNSLDSQWQGEAQKQFASAYSKLKPKLTTISGVLEKYTTEINNAVATEQAQEVTISGRISHLPDWLRGAIPIVAPIARGIPAGSPIRSNKNVKQGGGTSFSGSGGAAGGRGENANSEAQEPCGEQQNTIIDSEMIDNYTQTKGDSTHVQRGRIRWVYQNGDYYNNGWASTDGNIHCNPGIQCNSASASMALSYMGIDRSPASLVGPDTMDPASSGTCIKTWTSNSGDTIRLENHALECDMDDINNKIEAFQNDGNKGDVSPVLIRYSYPGQDASNPGANGHWLVIVGNNGDGTYQVIGPASENERLTTIRINDNGYIEGTGISKGGGQIQRYAQYTRQ